AVEVPLPDLERRHPDRNEHGATATAQAQPARPRQGARRRPPAGQRAGVVERDLLRPAQVLPARAEEPQDFVPAAGAGQAQAHGAVEGLLADPEVVARASALEGDRPYPIDLVELVGGPGRGAGILLAWQQRRQADPWSGQAVAPQDT